MYDSTTADVIRRTPPLRDLDRDSLPEKFTEAFARIAAARVRLRTGEEPAENLDSTRQFARRLAQTNETLVALGPDREDRKPAAFVAATAYQLAYQIDVVSDVATQNTRLEAAAITPDVSAMLLFLIAESPADATEVSRRIRITDNELEGELLRTLVDLAQGRVTRINQRPLVAVDSTVRSAANALYHLILRGVRALASNLAGQETLDDSSTILRQAHALASQVEDGSPRPDDGETAPLVHGPVALFPGPYHLASLLLAAADTLTEAAVVKVPPPDNLDPVGWARLVNSIAEKRPYLWPNHQNAISRGYLQAGVSSVVGFPTGAGKSAVFQLKIGAALLTGCRVVFLAPTHALVDQTRRDLKRTFPTVQIFAERLVESDFLHAQKFSSNVAIMTPEACLHLQHMEPSAFRDVGLLVFDECHLIHPRPDLDRRSIDAMLCIVNFVRMVPNADLLLLSAMISNAKEVAEWIADMTGRDALDFDMAWKPTRQLRGCVVYEQQRIVELSEMLQQEKGRLGMKGVPNAIKRQLGAVPYGFFSVKQTWATRNRSDYAYLPLSSDAPELGANSQWKLTPNAGVTAATLAKAAARTGINTLVFSQSIRMAASIARRVAKSLGPREVSLNSDERQWSTVAADELGGTKHLYVEIANDMLVVAAAAHHGLLLPEERQLIESLYGRADGLAVLSATSTLGQGMNTPSEMVIIAEDSRFEEQTGRRELLEAPELLNAAGRAGRAGRNATGIVIVIPGRVVGFNDSESQIGAEWEKRREIFGQTDQCLAIDDPLTAVLDSIHNGAERSGDLERYVVSRLRGTVVQESGGSGEPVAINRTFGAFRKSRDGDEAWLVSRTEAALALLKDLEADDDAAQAVRHLSSSLGLPEDALSALRVDVLDAAPSPYDTVAEWRRWMLEWMSSHPEQTMRMFRSEDLAQQFGTPFTDLQDDEARVRYALPKLERALDLWMGGEPLTDIQPVLGGSRADVKKLVSARKFVIRVLPTLAHVFSALPRIINEQIDTGENFQDIAPTVFFLARCVRLGLSSIEMYALYEHVQPEPLSRREIHRRFETMREHLAPPSDKERWSDLKIRVAKAWNAAGSIAPMG